MYAHVSGLHGNRDHRAELLMPIRIYKQNQLNINSYHRYWRVGKALQPGVQDFQRK